jgi:UPF0755 protein
VKRFVLLSVLVLAVAAGAAAIWVTRTVSAPYASFSGETFVEIPQGESTVGIGRRLVAAGVIRDELTFRLAERWHARGRSLKAGEYRFSGAASPAAVIDRIARGDVYLVPVTFPEGLTAEEMSQLFEQTGMGNAEAFMTAARSPDAIKAIDP